MTTYEQYRRVRREFMGRDPVFDVRPGTSDVDSVNEVFDHNSYRSRKHGLAVESGETWLDLGANIGAFSVLAVRLGAHVHAYEADATNAALTAHNLDRNTLTAAQHQVHHAAVVADDDARPTVTLHTNSTPLGLRRHSIVRRREASTPVAVPAVRFGDAVARAGATAAKLNIEGAEIALLQAAIPRGLHGLTKLAVEWSFDVDPRLATLKAVVSGLERAGYYVGLSKRVDWTKPTWDHYPPNIFLYVRKL